MFRAGERNHRKPVREWCEMLLQFVWRPARWDKMNFVEIETAVGCARDSEMAVMDWIERAAKKRDAARMVSCGGAVRLGDGQCVSVDGGCSLFSCGSCSKSSEECETLGI